MKILPLKLFYTLSLKLVQSAYYRESGVQLFSFVCLQALCLKVKVLLPRLYNALLR
jgi:hypothetical protein